MAVEVAELMRLFTWLTESESNTAVQGDLRDAATDERADVIIFSLAFANRCGVDIAEAVKQKLAKNRVKYPAEEFKGSVQQGNTR